MALDFDTSLDIGPFERGLRSMESDAKSSASKIGGAFEGIGGALAGAFSVGAVIAGGRALLDFAGDLVDASEAAQLSTDQFQGFLGVLEQSGVDQEKFTKGMATLNASLQHAKDDTGGARDAFEKLGIEWKDIANDGPDEILLKIAEGLKNAKDPQEAFAAATELLGAKQVKMVAALKMGRDALQEQADAASKLSKEDIESMDRLGDSFTRLGRSVKVFAGTSFMGAADGLELILGKITGASLTSQKAMDDFAKNGQVVHRHKGMTEAAAEETAAKSKEDPRIAKAKEEALKQEDEAFRKFNEEQSKLLHAKYMQELKDSQDVVQLRSEAMEIERKALEDSLDGVAKIAALEEDRLAILNEIATAEDLEAAKLGKKLAQKDAEIQKAKQLEAAEQAKSNTEAGKKLGELTNALSEAGPHDWAKDDPNHLLNSKERRKFDDAEVAAGHGRRASNENAFGAVRSGDRKRQMEHAKDDLRKKLEMSSTDTILNKILILTKNVWMPDK